MTHVAHINFDTFKFFERLKQSGVPEVQAQAMLEVQRESFEQALDNTLATKVDIYAVKTEIQDVKTEIVSVKTELKSDFRALSVEMIYMRWMLGVLIIGVGSLVLKAFM